MRRSGFNLELFLKAILLCCRRGAASLGPQFLIYKMGLIMAIACKACQWEMKFFHEGICFLFSWRKSLSLGFFQVSTVFQTFYLFLLQIHSKTRSPSFTEKRSR